MLSDDLIVPGVERADDGARTWGGTRQGAGPTISYKGKEGEVVEVLLVEEAEVKGGVPRTEPGHGMMGDLGKSGYAACLVTEDPVPCSLLHADHASFKPLIV